AASGEWGSLMRAMTDRARVLALILIVTIGLLLVTGITIGILYRAAFEEERARLVESAQSQARLIEAVARYDAAHSSDLPGGGGAATLQQIRDAHLGYEGFGETGEFTMARREGDFIVFVLEHRYMHIGLPEPVLFASARAEPMRRALLGQSGTVVGLDYREVVVLAAYEPVDVLDLGIVAKIDLEEVRAPFWRAGLSAIGFSLAVAVVAALLLVRVSNPLVTELQVRTRLLEETVAALGRSEEHFRSTYELAGVGIAQLALDGKLSNVNQRICEITGYSAEEIKGLSFQEITYPEDLDTDREYARQLLVGEIERYSTEKRYIRKDASVIWVNLTGSLVRDGDGNPQHFIAVVEDITARRDAETALKRSLDEKEVLLREIHHRVKNNMQVISSLLSLQAANIDDARLRKLFMESQGRVRAMALIHEILDDSGDLSSIDVKKYVSRLVASLTRMFGTDAGRTRVTVESQDVTLGIDAMVACGLALSELITNSLKYAFPDGRHGEISIRVFSVPEGGIKLVVRDNGIGLPADLDIRATKTMGMGLVVSLIEKQLRGQLEIESSQGTCFTIVIPSKVANA
ncbi:MAG: PAS domain S-box protein, partial [Thermoanaerobaculales bacterium]|nr:PAS domain S-box protein [Thermoanaerobaculales bacterium]